MLANALDVDATLPDDRALRREAVIRVGESPRSWPQGGVGCSRRKADGGVWRDSRPQNLSSTCGRSPTPMLVSSRLHRRRPLSLQRPRRRHLHPPRHASCRRVAASLAGATYGTAHGQSSALRTIPRRARRPASDDWAAWPCRPRGVALLCIRRESTQLYTFEYEFLCVYSAGVCCCLLLVLREGTPVRAGYEYRFSTSLTC